MPTLNHSFDTPGSTQDWEPSNDGVMGGVAGGQMRFHLAGYAVFEGNISLEIREDLLLCGHHSLTWDAPGAPPLRLEAVRQVGLMISDKQAGAIRLMVKTIAAAAIF